MSKTARLFDLTQALRRRQRPTPATALAEALGVSQRTIYRDVQALQALGAPIEGEPGAGYLMRQEWRLPSPVFTEAELHALAWGAHALQAQATHPGAEAARSALAKLLPLLPSFNSEAGPPMPWAAEAQAMATDTAASSSEAAQQAEAHTRASRQAALLRRAIRFELKLRIQHAAADAIAAPRTVWPITLVDFDAARVLVAWCESAGGFRHFRTDRITEATLLDLRYPTSRLALIRDWHAQEASAAALNPESSDG